MLKKFEKIKLKDKSENSLRSLQDNCNEDGETQINNGSKAVVDVNNINFLTIHIENNEAKLSVSILKWLSKNYDFLPTALIHKSLRKKLIQVNNKKVVANYILQLGDVVRMPNWNKENFSQKKVKRHIYDENFIKLIKSNVIYEDNNIIAINKPNAVATQGGTNIKISIDDILQFLSDSKQDNLKLVHRLDLKTSGILLLAKNATVATQILKYFQQRQIEKTYLAITKGVPKIHEGCIITAPDKCVLQYVNNQGKIQNLELQYALSGAQLSQPAKTYYKVLDYADRQYALIQFKPETGRKHQIRIHSTHICRGIIGDYKYLNDANYFTNRNNSKNNSNDDKNLNIREDKYSKAKNSQIKSKGFKQDESKILVNNQTDNQTDGLVNLMSGDGLLYLHAHKISCKNFIGKKLHITASVPKYFHNKIKDLGISVKHLL